MISLLLIGSVVLSERVAVAAQNPSLHALIISDPIPGGVAFPAQTENATANSISSFEQSVTKRFNLRVGVAIAGWHEASSTKQLTSVLLIGVALPRSTSSTGAEAFVRTGSSSASSTFCVGATEEPAVSDTAIASIPNSHEVTCSKVDGRTFVAVSFGKASVIGLVYGDVFDAGQLRAIAQAQYDRVPTTAIAIPRS